MTPDLARRRALLTGRAMIAYQMLNRRRFLQAVSARLLAVPLAAEAQQAGKVWRIGYLGNQGPTAKGVEELRAEGKYDRLPDLAAEFVRLKVDVLVTGGTPGTRAAKHSAAKKQLALAGQPTFAEAGGRIGYSVDQLTLVRRAAYFVDKILKGAEPADIPIERPSKFELVINMKAARAIGLTIPPSLLLRADQIIE